MYTEVWRKPIQKRKFWKTLPLTTKIRYYCVPLLKYLLGPLLIIIGILVITLCLLITYFIYRAFLNGTKNLASMISDGNWGFLKNWAEKIKTNINFEYLNGKYEALVSIVIDHVLQIYGSLNEAMQMFFVDIGGA
ncbi:uncharacterized protein LOC119679767 [Teleopsis dalmanni]|uniref:uncharacterized protein LOC119679767 n=1 Tax=Teleopsis dalmanni TaxID=139649 RepID=UPI000D32C972|nr:uncharacterized protein LOC119679767 [Teleopsis dalmanni]